jgi:xanthine dehydrogenase YagR molybdenum-binding subunit
MYIGQPLDRRDGRLKITGGARYAAEFQIPNHVHAVLVQSTVAAGTIIGFDLAGAQGMPGVLAIITPENAIRLKPGKDAQSVEGPLLQDTNVAFNGQHVAIAVADTLERALAAAAAVKVSYKEGEALTTMDQGQPVMPKKFRNGQRPPDSNRGDPDGAFANAAVKIDVTYVTPVEHHNPMEPHATVAAWDGDALTVWHSTQGVSGTQSTLATQFGIPPAKVRVLCPFLGGGFGCKGSTWPPATLAAMAAKMVGRPVKLVLTRAQMYNSNGYRPRTVQKIRMAADGDGKLVAIRHDGQSQMSTPAFGEFVEPVALATEMLYACPNVAVTHRIVPINAGLPTYMRAPGEASGVFALESAMDEMAAALDMDPLEFRLINYAETDQHENKPFSSKRLRECYRQGAAAFGWDQRSRSPRSMREGDMLVGYGMATATYPINRQAASATVRILADGTAWVGCGTQDIGTGTYTVMAQIAADELGLAPGRVAVALGDSRLPHAPNSGGSQTVASIGPAIQAAAIAAREQVFALALADQALGWQGLTKADLRLRDGAVLAPGKRRASVAELLAHLGRDAVEASAEAKPGKERDAFSMHSFGAQFAEVRVDPDLGIVRLARLVGAFDTGRVMNAKTARSQLLGGMVFGVGMVLLEETRIDRDTGRVVNSNIAEYLLPVNADIPDMQVITVEGDDRNANPIGAKGLGELPMVGMAAAIANAVWHATGVRVRELPIRIEQLLV